MVRMPFSSKSILVCVALAALATVLQAQNPRGSLRGTVQDVTGARIPAAQIAVESVDSSMRREAASEDRGEFRLDDLLPGAYRITVNAAGFAPAHADVSVAVSSVREVTVTLKAAAPGETVSVQGQNSSITTQPIDLVSVVHQGDASARGAQLCQHRVPGSGDRTRGTFRSDEGADYGGFYRGEFRAEQ